MQFVELNNYVNSADESDDDQPDAAIQRSQDVDSDDSDEPEPVKRPSFDSKSRAHFIKEKSANQKPFASTKLSFVDNFALFEKFKKIRAKKKELENNTMVRLSEISNFLFAELVRRNEELNRERAMIVEALMSKQDI